jgi:hypothetical protein
MQDVRQAKLVDGATGKVLRGHKEQFLPVVRVLSGGAGEQDCVPFIISPSCIPGNFADRRCFQITMSAHDDSSHSL